MIVTECREMGGREGARGGNDWKVINDLNKNTLRISSYEGCEQVKLRNSLLCSELLQ